MPEGDTLHRTAAALRRAILGHRLTRLELPRAPLPVPGVGARVERILARGKHLLIELSDEHTLHSHLGMTGSWHLYAPGDRWRGAPGAVRAVLGTDVATAVCFSAPVVELLTSREVARHPTLRGLGPDLCDPPVDTEAILSRVGRLASPRQPVAQLLLDQRVACGVGNIYRSEVLFLHRLHPSTPLGHVPEAELKPIFATAAELLQRNLATTRRTTVPRTRPGALWVYDRTGRPCRRCGTRVQRGVVGEPPRSVFWCPSCQAAADRVPA